jgi:hypothetical protein
VKFPAITASVMIIPFIILTWSIPVELGAKQSTHYAVFYKFGGTILFSITIFAYIYFKHGVYVSGNRTNVDFFDALYFSITTWTTLGYGDFLPVPECRLTTSIEALIGYFSMAVFIILTGMFITEGKQIVNSWLGDS